MKSGAINLTQRTGATSLCIKLPFAAARMNPTLSSFELWCDNLVRACGLVLASTSLQKVFSPICSTTTATVNYPASTATPLALLSYSYCGGNLTAQAYIEVKSTPCPKSGIVFR